LQASQNDKNRDFQFFEKSHFYMFSYENSKFWTLQNPKTSKIKIKVNKLNNS